MDRMHPANMSRRWRRLMWLFAVLFAVAGTFFWNRYIRPRQLLTAAEKSAASNPSKAEELAADAIFCAGGTFPEAQFFRTVLLGRLGRWDEALGQFSLIDRPEQLPPEDLAAFAGDALRQGFPYLAEQAFLAAEQDDEIRPQVLRSLINIYLRSGREDRARETCLALLDLVPDDTTAWQILGTVAMNRKNLAEAEQAFLQCLRTSDDDDRNRDVREDLIQVYIDGGKLSEAREELQVLRDSGSTLSDRAVLEEAWLFRLEGRPDEGVNVVDPLIDAGSKQLINAYLLRGMLHADAGRGEAAVADLERVIADQPWNKEAHQKLAVLHAGLGNEALSQTHRDAAEQLTNKAIRLLELKDQLFKKPGDTALRREVARLYEQLGETEQARRLLPSGR